MQKRRLAAIMSARRSHCEGGFTDIVGYTALMGSDEDRAFEVLDKNLEIHNQLVEKYNGTLIKEMDDNLSRHSDYKRIVRAIKTAKNVLKEDH